MDFRSAVEKIMPEVERGGTAPLIIYRDSNAQWHCDITINQYGDTFDWVEDIKLQDPFAKIYTGADFSHGSYSYVYDKVLCDRLHAEQHNGCWVTNYEEFHAFANFLEDNISELSSETTEYVVRYDRPLAMLFDMIPISMVNDDGTYDLSKAQNAIELIEHKIGILTERRAEADIAISKRTIDGYTENQSIQLAGHLVIFAENKNADEQYMVCFCKWDNPLNMAQYYNICTTDDYVEAMGLYASGIQSFVKILESERNGYNNPAKMLTAADCIPGSLNENFEGKIVVIKPEALSPEYRRSERQLKIALSGFGCNPDARGRAVYCKDLYSGKESRFERHDVAGVIDPAKMPNWAVKKIEIQKSSDKIEQKKNPSMQKPSLLGKLDNNKQKVKRDKEAKKDQTATKKRGTEIMD